MCKNPTLMRIKTTPTFKIFPNLMIFDYIIKVSFEMRCLTGSVLQILSLGISKNDSNNIAISYKNCCCVYVNACESYPLQQHCVWECSVLFTILYVVNFILSCVILSFLSIFIFNICLILSPSIWLYTVQLNNNIRTNFVHKMISTKLSNYLNNELLCKEQTVLNDTSGSV